MLDRSKSDERNPMKSRILGYNGRNEMKWAGGALTPRPVTRKGSVPVPDQCIPITTEDTTEYELISRNEAIVQGLTTYFTGKPCPYGHIDLRFVASYGCRECMRLATKRKYDADPKAAIARTTRFQRANVQQTTSTRRKWNERNRSRYITARMNSEAKARGASGRVTPEEWDALLARCDHKCVRCGRGDVDLGGDHIKPIALGGANTIDNLQPMCERCNHQKHLQTIDYRP